MGNIFKAGVTAIKDPTNPPNPLKPFTSIRSTDPKAAATDGTLDPYQLGLDSLRAQIELAGPQYDAEAKYAPKYVDLNNDLLRRSLYGTPSFDAKAYLASRPDLQANWESDPNYAQIYGSLEKYAEADWKGNSNDPKFQTTSGGLYGLLPDMTKAEGEANALANTLQRTADVNDVKNLGQSVFDLTKQFNPDYYKSIGAINDAAAKGVTYDKVGLNGNVRDVNALMGFDRVSAGSNGLVDTLEQQAQADLALGGALSAQEQRAAQQAARVAGGARGRLMDNSSFANEILNTDAASRARLNERRAFASGVSDLRTQQQGLGLEAQSQNLGAQLQGNQLNLQAQQTNQNKDLALTDADLRAQFANQQAGMNAQNMSFNQLLSASGANQQAFFDPFQGVLGRSSVNQGTNAGLLGQANTATTAGPQLFNPFSSDIMSIYAGNQANQTAANTAAANNKAAKTSAGIGAGASIAGAVIIAI